MVALELAAPGCLVGADVQVPCVDGRERRYVNLDYAASTPVMADVWEAVEAFMPWYSSVHRGTGVKSQVATEAFEDARDDVAAFVGARAGRRRRVRAQHHRGDQRARRRAAGGHAGALHARSSTTRTCSRGGSTTCGCCRSRARPTSCSTPGEQALRGARLDLVAVTGASNVTGEVWPVAELADDRARHGAKLFVDAAQLAPHRAIDMAASGHRLPRASPATSSTRRSAPARWSAACRATGEPLLQGGGAIKLVTLDDVIWADAPDRFEAGSPNVVGVVALAAACRSAARPRHGRRRRARARARGAPVGRPRERARPRDADAVAAPAASTASASPPSISTATATRCWPRSSAPSTRSACATAASARTR